MVAGSPVAAPAGCAMCDGTALRHVATYDRPPPGETDFAIAGYRRTMWQCAECGHVVNRYGFDLSAALYQGRYGEATYGTAMRQSYDRIMSLPPERSDNRQRVRRVLQHLAGKPTGRLLDVGSGLGVFPAAMSEAGWECTALDPDPRAIAMIESAADVRGLCGDFMSLAPGSRFDLVSFNKVLEHVPDPSAMLARAVPWLAAEGTVYIELPDGEAALAEGPGREEFFVEHYHAFSTTSLALLARRAGFLTRVVERVHEPSDKYTLCAFLTPAAP